MHSAGLVKLICLVHGIKYSNVAVFLSQPCTIIHTQSASTGSPTESEVGLACLEHKETLAKSLDIFLDTFSFFDLTGNLKSFRGFFVVM